MDQALSPLVYGVTSKQKYSHVHDGSDYDITHSRYMMNIFQPRRSGFPAFLPYSEYDEVMTANHSTECVLQCNVTQECDLVQITDDGPNYVTCHLRGTCKTYILQR